MKKNILFSLIFICFLPAAKAYIPSYSMILSHLAHSQGRGGYRIEQELVFKQAVEPLYLKETWWILGAGQMRLDVKAKKTEFKDFYLRFIYQKNKKIFKDENNQIQNQPLSYYHLEKPFHLRSAQKLKRLFSFWKVAPFQIPERKEGQGSDSFVRLSRKGGSLQYQIGEGKARVWLEQDEFVIRSWKWLSGESLIAWDYKLYPRYLFFPSQRLFRYHSGEVLIQVQKVQSLQIGKNWINSSKLSKRNTLPQSLSSADQDRVREFYEKFR